jgi:hypothetical protein
MTADQAIAKLAETGVATPEMQVALYAAGLIERAPFFASGWTLTDRGLAAYRGKRGAKCEVTNPYDDDAPVAQIAWQEGFEAGRASRDAEVDEWKAKVAELVGTEQVKLVRPPLVVSRAEFESALAEMTQNERINEQTLVQRDAFHDRIDEIADALGDESEWSNLSDRGANALELAHALRAKYDSERALTRKMSEEHGGERAWVLSLTGQLYEHLALMVRYFEEETAQGDGVAEEHSDGYGAAKALLEHARQNEPQWENASLAVRDLQLKAAEVPGLTATLDELRAQLAEKDADHTRKVLEVGLWKARFSVVRDAMGIAEGTSSEDVARMARNLVENARGHEAKLTEKDANAQRRIDAIQRMRTEEQDAYRVGLAEKDAEIARLRLDLARVRETARELTSWDWRHLLIDHPDSETVEKEMIALEQALAPTGEPNAQ